MAQIQIDDKTASTLYQLAYQSGKDVSEYVRALVDSLIGPVPQPLSDDAFETELSKLSHDGPSLPGGFSRKDIYFDND